MVLPHLPQKPYRLLLYFCAVLLAVCSISVSHAEKRYTCDIIPDRLAPGDAAFVCVEPADEIASASVTWCGMTVDLQPLADSNKLAAFISADLSARPGDTPATIRYTTRSGQTQSATVDIAIVSRDFPVQRLSLPESKVTLSPENLKRHKKEKAAVSKAFSQAARRKLWKNGFHRPVPGPVSTPFGVRRILNGKPRNPHSGVDFKSAAGDPVRALSAGSVILTGNHFFAGNSVYVDHGMGIVSMYFHLSEIAVTAGQSVASGEIIGRVGSTGRSTGPHLHFGIRIHNRKADPLSFLSIAKNAL